MLHLNVIAGEDTDRTINIKCLLYHWFCVIKHVRSDTRCCELLNPLFKLALEPKAVKVRMEFVFRLQIMISIY